MQLPIPRSCGQRWVPLFRWIPLSAGLLLCATPALGSTVLPMDLPTVADHAGQVIVGRVASVRSYRTDAQRGIETEVVFEEVEYLKGALADSTDSFRLIVPGGEVDGLRMELCGAPSFEVGQKWVLCLLPTYRTFPVVGLFQGAFLVRPDADGVEWVGYAHHGAFVPITGVDAAGNVVRGDGHGRGGLNDYLLEAVNILPTEPSAPRGPTSAMTYDEFVARLRPILAASRNHRLSEPAGRRVVVQGGAVPLVTAQESRPRDDAPAATVRDTNPPTRLGAGHRGARP